MGLATAKRFVQEAMDHVFIIGRRKDALDRAVSEIGKNVTAVQGDVASLSDLDRLYDEVRKQNRKIDVIFANAGIAQLAPFGTVDEKFYDLHFDANVKGLFFTVQKALPLMNDGGGIVNISSGLTRTTVPRSSVYASMKSAVETFTRYLAKELGSRSIRANVVAPGAIMTDFGGGHLRNDQELQKFISGITALGRPGVAEDIGGVVAFLCTEDARWVNGQRIEASGGMNV